MGTKVLPLIEKLNDRIMEPLVLKRVELKNRVSKATSQILTLAYKRPFCLVLDQAGRLHQFLKCQSSESFLGCQNIGIEKECGSTDVRK